MKDYYCTIEDFIKNFKISENPNLFEEVVKNELDNKQRQIDELKKSLSELSLKFDNFAK